MTGTCCPSKNAYSLREVIIPSSSFSQATDTEIVARLEKSNGKLFKAFLKSMIYIPPDEKCMALLLTRSDFLRLARLGRREGRIKPEDMQELHS
ncbi:hypothetical protein Tco_0525878 [Tanacetum coccineum]